jgi:hypothetical protein
MLNTQVECTTCLAWSTMAPSLVLALYSSDLASESECCMHLIASFNSSCGGLRHAEGPYQLVTLPTGSLVLPAFVRNEYATRSTATCIDPRQEVVNIYLVWPTDLQLC